MLIYFSLRRGCGKCQIIDCGIHLKGHMVLPFGSASTLSVSHSEAESSVHGSVEPDRKTKILEVLRVCFSSCLYC
jgi:hypothetical protein